MTSLRNQIKLSLLLAFGALAALLISHLALTDIYHGETDVAAEWRALQVSAAVITASVASTVVTLIRILKSVT